MADAGARRILFAAMMGAVACGGDGEPATEKEVARGAPPENHATTPANDLSNPSSASDTMPPPCPATGQWAECTVVDRLEQAGLVMDRQQEPATEAPLQQHGVVFSVRNATLEVYIYPDEPARARDQRRLPADDYLAADQAPEPVHKPTIVTSGNLLIILDTQRERQRERITLAITAGPPQPATP